MQLGFVGEKAVWVKCHFHGFCHFLAQENLGGFLVVGDFCYFSPFIILFDGVVGKEEEYIF